MASGCPRGAGRAGAPRASGTFRAPHPVHGVRSAQPDVHAIVTSTVGYVT